MNYHSVSAEEALKKVESQEGGLTTEEAAKRLAANGRNALIGAKKKPWIVKLLMQFADPMIIVLLVAAVVTAVIAFVNEEPGELIDSGIILLIVIVNAVIGLVQENKAENALEALKEKNKPFAKVIRNGEQLSIPGEELVVGDIVVLEAGDVVPADLRLISSASLKIEEAALTGESVPVEKHADQIIDEKAPLGDRVNSAFSGGTVTYGRGQGVVVATGMKTEIGKIADMLSQTAESPSPLSKQLAKPLRFYPCWCLQLPQLFLQLI